MTFVITVDDVRYPQMGKKTGTVKDTSGRYWSVFADKLHDFQRGGQIEVQQTRTWTSQQGKTFETIVAYRPLGGASQVQHPSPQPVPLRAIEGGKANGDDEKRQLQIFICGAFNNIMSNPNIDPRELKMVDMMDTIHKLKGAWLGVFGPSPLPQRPKQDPSISSGDSSVMMPNNDMNDEIPF